MVNKKDKSVKEQIIEDLRLFVLGIMGDAKVGKLDEAVKKEDEFRREIVKALEREFLLGYSSKENELYNLKRAFMDAEREKTEYLIILYEILKFGRECDLLEDAPLAKIIAVLDEEIGMVTMAESTDRAIRDIRDKIRIKLRGGDSEESRKTEAGERGTEG